MPGGRPRKNTAKVELLPPEENSLPMRQVKHKAEWVELQPVEESPEEEGEEFEDDATEDRPKRKIKNAREELRKKLRAQGVAPSTNLKLYIEKYLHSDSNAGGSWAETEFCTKYDTTEEHILNKDYIDAARRWGAGKYRITIRMQNKIVDAFDQRISVTPTMPMLQHVNPNDPTSPQVIVQMPEGMGAQQPISVVDPLKQMREAAKFYKEMKQTFEPEGLQPAQPQRSEEEILAGAILKQPEVIENIVGSVVKRFGGGSSGKDDEPWYADVVKDAVKSGQLAQVVQVAIDRIFNGVGNLFPGRQDNGQAQVVQAPLQTVQSQSVNPDDGATLLQQGSMGKANLQGESNETQESAGVVQSQTITPEEQALQRLIENCARQVPVQVAFDQLINHADWLNDQAPQYSIDGYLSMFAAMPIEAALEFVKTQPNGEAIVSLPHAKEWTAELQKLIKEAGQEGEE